MTQMTIQQLIDWCFKHEISPDAVIYVWDLGEGDMVPATIDEDMTGGSFELPPLERLVIESAVIREEEPPDDLSY